MICIIIYNFSFNISLKKKIIYFKAKKIKSHKKVCAIGFGPILCGKK